MFDLKRPCINCPFRKGVGENFILPEARIDEIMSADAFQCHKTVEYGQDNYGNQTYDQGDKPQQCAGLMAVLHREGKPNQIMRIAERVGAVTFDDIDPRNEAYASIADVKEANRKYLAR